MTVDTLPSELAVQAARFAAGCEARAGRGRLLLAVSGGPDSMAMLVLAAAARMDVAVATVDHRLRAEAAAEAAGVAESCARFGIPHQVLAPDAPPSGASLQAQARGVRYRLLAEAAAVAGAVAVATAHHIDDQAETFLMRAARGSGVAGLAGVRARTVLAGVTVIRPLLDWRRAELRAIVRRAEVPFVDDPANSDPRHDRTRFRQLLNANEWLDPPASARAAGAVAEADADLGAVADWLWGTRARVAEGEVVLDAADLPRALARRLVWRALAAVRAEGVVEGGEPGAIEPLLDALAGGRRATQGGVIASARSGPWRFRPAPRRRAS